MTIAAKVGLGIVGVGSWSSLFFIPPNNSLNYQSFKDDIKNYKYTKWSDAELKKIRHDDLKQGDGQNFALGCHQTLFFTRNHLKIHVDAHNNDKKDTSTNADVTPHNYSYWGSSKYPLLGCSTAFVRKETSGNKKVFEFELALKQGDKGFIERISVHEDKIVSQITFHEKDPDPQNKWPFINRFALLRRKQQSHKSGSDSVYEWANPTDSSNTFWSKLDLSTVTDSNNPNYFVVWVEESSRTSEKIFDRLGVKSNGKLFSSVASLDETSFDGFWYFHKQPDSAQGQTKYYVKVDKHVNKYELSDLAWLASDIDRRRGSWVDIKEFCDSFEENKYKETTIELRKALAVKSYCYKSSQQGN